MPGKPLVGFVGQGYLGKNYADDFEARGYDIVRYALEEPYRGNKDRIKECDVVFVGVPTPTTPEGFDDSIVREAVGLAGVGKIVVVKSTVVPGTTVSIRAQYPDRIVLYSPEFLSEATAAYDAAHPFANIVGTTGTEREDAAAAELVLSILPSAPFSLACSASEGEIIKYTHNGSGYTQIVFFNMMYDLAAALGASWEPVRKAMEADPLVCNRYANPVHKSGRGAGGHCFIKDFAALRETYEKLVHEPAGVRAFTALEEKNRELLTESGKDAELVAGVYGPQEK
jgi:nucleotide sugar dehydrogenase